jgi:hypothetical protein
MTGNTGLMEVMMIGWLRWLETGSSLRGKMRKHFILIWKHFKMSLNRFANITDGSIIGCRAPYLRVGGNKQFEMMADQFFVYDASITAPLGRVPIWPYTLYFRMPHKCHGNAQNCPSRSHPVWEMVMNELDRRDDPTFDESLPGCHMVSSCSNIQTGDQFGRYL